MRRASGGGAQRDIELELLKNEVAVSIDDAALSHMRQEVLAFIYTRCPLPHAPTASPPARPRLSENTETAGAGLEWAAGASGLHRRGPQSR